MCNEVDSLIFRPSNVRIKKYNFLLPEYIHLLKLCIFGQESSYWLVVFVMYSVPSL